MRCFGGMTAVRKQTRVDATGMSPNWQTREFKSFWRDRQNGVRESVAVGRCATSFGLEQRQAKFQSDRC